MQNELTDECMDPRQLYILILVPQLSWHLVPFRATFALSSPNRESCCSCFNSQIVSSFGLMYGGDQDVAIRWISVSSCYFCCPSHNQCLNFFINCAQSSFVWHLSSSFVCNIIVCGCRTGACPFQTSTLPLSFIPDLLLFKTGLTKLPKLALNLLCSRS